MDKMIKIEKGLKLYSLMYFFGERNFRQFTINKISKTKNGTFLISKDGIRLKLEEIGDTWFSTKDECYLKSFMNHVMARKYHDGLDKEYKFLKNKVKEMYFRDKPIDLIEEALIDYAEKSKTDEKQKIINFIIRNEVLNKLDVSYLNDILSDVEMFDLYHDLSEHEHNKNSCPFCGDC